MKISLTRDELVKLITEVYEEDYDVVNVRLTPYGDYVAEVTLKEPAAPAVQEPAP